MAEKGKAMVIQVSTDDSTYTTVAELNSGTMTHQGNQIDITEFGDDYVARIQGLKDGSYSLGGFYKPDDTDGQKAVHDALLNDTSLYVQFLYDGTNGFKQEVKVSSFEVSASPSEAQGVSIELEGTGTISAVP